MKMKAQVAMVFATVCRLGKSWVVPHQAQRMATRRLAMASELEGSLIIRDAASGSRVTLDHGKRRLRWYACGPTVYDAAHLGHARTYVTLDLLVRAARVYGGMDVEYAMGVTDIDDKIIARAAELGVSPTELARSEERKFFEDMRRLGCMEPSRLLRVSEHMDDVINFIEDIKAQGYAYATKDGSVWFDVAKLGELYGTFAEGRGTSSAAAANEEVVDTSPSLKRDGRDFALWKAAKPGEPSWESPWGPGRPGWHIECSAMTRAAFGELLDLHAGGVDLAFPHHENEIAQWRGAREAGKRADRWCSCWLHTGHLHIEGRKMSKSLKNFVTVREMLAEGSTTPDDFRLFCAVHRYRTTVSFGRDKLDEARRVRLELEAALLQSRDALREAEAAPRASKRFGPLEDDLAEATVSKRADIRAALLDDLDTPSAMAAILDLATRTRQYCVSARATGNGVVIQEPLTEAAETLASSLQNLGLVATANAWYDAAPANKLDDQESPALELALNALVELRSNLRSVALAAPKTDSLRGTILEICDAARDSPALKTLGFAMLDKTDGTTVLARALADVHDDAKSPSDKAPARGRHDKYDVVKDIPPDQLFRVAGEFAGRFSAYDESGLPTHDVDGNELSKSKRKKLRKRLDIHTAKWLSRDQANEERNPQPSESAPLST